MRLSGGRYAVAISWDRAGAAVDLDLQCVVVDDRGSIIDAVYYNNMKAQRCITHSGDERTGDRSGLDEVIWAGLAKMPEKVKMLVFVVAAHSGGRLRDVRNGNIHILEERKENEVGRIAIEKSDFAVDVVVVMVKNAGGWELQVIDEPAQEGQHFMDVLEPTMGNIIRKVIPTAPKRMKVAFAMEKGAVVELPDTGSLKSVTAGLGWDVLGRGVDLDVSAVCFDGQGQLVDTVFFGRLQSCGLVHSGDNLTGAGDGDDEQIKCNLDQVPARVEQIVFTVHIYTKGVTFQKVSNAYCRIFDGSGAELARYELREAGRESGLIIARLFREPGAQRWGFQALGTFTRGSMWKDSLNDLAAVVGKAPRAFQLRGQTTMQFSGAGGEPVTAHAPHAPAVAAGLCGHPPRQEQKCAVQ